MVTCRTAKKNKWQSEGVQAAVFAVCRAARISISVEPATKERAASASLRRGLPGPASAASAARSRASPATRPQTGDAVFGEWQIGRAHDRNTVNNEKHACRHQLEKKQDTITKH